MPDGMMQEAMQGQPPAGPQGSPMAQPSQNEGNKQLGMVQVESAMQLLDQSVSMLGSNTPEGASVLKALTILSKHVNRQKEQQLVPAQIMQLQQAAQPNPMQGMA